MKAAEFYPIGCDHKRPDGLSSWSFMSESSGNVSQNHSFYVCLKCGEFRVSGTPAEGTKFFSYEGHVIIKREFAAMLRNAAFFNEKPVADFIIEVIQELEELKTIWPGKNVKFERIMDAVGKSLQWKDGEIAGVDIIQLEQRVRGILGALPEQKEQVIEDYFINFIRTHHLTAKWEEYIKQNPEKELKTAEEIRQSIQTMMFCAFLQGQTGEPFNEWYERERFPERFIELFNQFKP